MKTFIIFDIDGTLLYSNKIDSKCFAESYETKFGKKFPSIDWTDFPHVTDHTIFGTAFRTHFNRTATAAEITDFENDFVALMQQKRKETPEEFREVPGARQTIENLLSDDRFEVGIATGGWQKPARFKLNHIGIDYTELHDGYADRKETREDIIKEAIEKAAQRQAKYDRIVYVGDAIWDVTTTRNMNLPLIGIRRNGDREVLERAGARHILQDYSDYNAFLEMVDVAETPV